MKANLEIHTERLILRSLNRLDILPLRDAISQSADTVGRWLDWCHGDFNETDARVWISNSRQSWTTDFRYEVAVIEKETEQLVGCICIYSIDRVANLANLGYWLSTPNQGKGYGFEATQRFVEFVFERLNITRLEIVIHPDNQLSQRIAKRLGAQLECLARNRLLFNGKIENGLLFSLIPSDILPKD